MSNLDVNKLKEKLKNVQKSFFDDNYAPQKIVVAVLKEDMTKGSSGQKTLNDDLKVQFSVVDECIGEIVNESYEQLNQSINNISDMQRNFTSAHDKLKTLNKTVLNSKSMLNNKTENLQQLYYEREKNSAVIRIVGKIKKIQEAPSLLQDFLSNKKYLSAVNLYNEIHTLIFSEILMNIGGIQSLGQNWIEQRKLLEDELLHELLNIIFLREDVIPNISDLLNKKSSVFRTINETYESRCTALTLFDRFIYLIYSLHTLGSLGNILGLLKDILLKELQGRIKHHMDNKSSNPPNVYASKLYQGDTTKVDLQVSIIRFILTDFESIYQHISGLYICLKYFQPDIEINFSLNTVWEIMQKEVILLIVPILSPNINKSSTLFDKSVIKNKFSFSKSIKVSSVEAVKVVDTTKETLYKVVCDPDPLLICTLSFPLIFFMRNILFIYDKQPKLDLVTFVRSGLLKTKDKFYSLLRYVNNFINTTLYNQLIDISNSKLQSFAFPQTITITKASDGSIEPFRNVTDFNDYLSVLMSDYSRLLAYPTSIQPVISYICEQFIQLYNSKIENLLQDSHTFARWLVLGDALEMRYINSKYHSKIPLMCSGGILLSTATASLENKSTKFKKFKVEEESSNCLDLDIDYLNFQPEQTLDKISLLSYPNLEVLCLLCESLHYLYITLSNIYLDMSSANTNNSTFSMGGSRASSTSGLTTGMGFFARRNKETAGTLLFQYITQIGNQYLTILYNLRTEIKARVTYNILNIYQYITVDDNDIITDTPDPCIINMEQDILKVSSILHEILRKEKAEFVLESIIELLPELMIRVIANNQLKEISLNGLKVLTRDAIGIQQIIFHLFFESCSDSFSNLNTYFGLLYLRKDKILEFIKANPYQFTKEQYEAIYMIVNPFRQGEEPSLDDPLIKELLVDEGSYD